MNYKFDKSYNMINVLSERISEEFFSLLENITMNDTSDIGLTSSEKEFYNKELKRLNYEMHDWEELYKKIHAFLQINIFNRIKKGIWGNSIINFSDIDIKNLRDIINEKL